MKMSENTKTKDKSPETKSNFVWIIFAIIIVAVYFFGLTIPLVGPDEPRYAQIAREMFERGDWITPKLGGFDWFEKPVLLYWLQIIAYKLFGVNEFAARFGSAIFGLGTIVCLWLLGRNYPQMNTDEHRFENQNTKDKGQRTKDNFSNWLAIIAASSIGLLSFSRGASFDIILTFPITASLVAYFLFDQREQKSGFTFYFLLFTFYFFVGVALLAKGLIGIVFPFAIISFYHILKWELVPSAKFCFSLIWGIPLILLVAASWYLPMYQVNGWKFVDEFIIQHHFQRYTSNKYQHPQPFWFFWIVLPLMTIPWIPFFIASIWNFLKVQSSKFKVQSPAIQEKSSAFYLLPFTLRKNLLLFSFAWLLVPLVFFSISGSKLPGYILPALPAACVLTADYVFRFVHKSKLRVVALQTVAFLMFAIIAVLLQFVVPKIAYADSVKGLMEVSNNQGFTNQKVLNLHTVSHNAEFYFPGRLVRDESGKIKKFLGVLEVVEEIRRGKSQEVLVLVPLDFLKELTESNLVESKILDDNGELSIVSVKNKVDF
jgi:4-amino-4-deoxy-L-arabinose transferase-like glycosyltransferase